MIRQFHDDRAERDTLRKFMKSAILVIGGLNGISALLLALHSLGFLH